MNDSMYPQATKALAQRRSELAPEAEAAWLSRVRDPRVDDPADGVSERMAVLTALASLSVADRETLMLVAWDGLTAPVLGIWAEHDDFVNPNVPGYEAELKKRGKQYEFVTYPGTQHAFFNDEHADTFKQKEANDSWQKSLAFFRSNL